MQTPGAPAVSAHLSRRRWYHRIGPGLITACVVIGPGSILTSSQVGAKHGYGLAWVVVAAVAFMMVYTALGAKLGVVARDPAGQLVADRAGRWLAVLIGLGVFFISAAFQFGNNLGVHSAFALYVDFDYTVVVFNAVAIAFLFAFKNLYRAVERLMMAFVALMLVSFAVNLFFARPDLAELAGGFLPGRAAQVDITLLGFVGTTFVITAAYYQSYLVRQKGWSRAELQDGLRDARAGAVIMALLTLMIMVTAAAVLYGRRLENVAHVARQLDPLFGASGQALFCLGLFSAAYSSFLVNSMIGGFILCDGLGLGSRPTDLAPKLFTAGVLLTGMGVALWIIKAKGDPVPAIVLAQAVTVIAAPLLAGTLLWLTNRRDVMGDERNSAAVNVVAGLGFVLLVAMAAHLGAVGIPGRIAQWREQQRLLGTWEVAGDQALDQESGASADSRGRTGRTGYRITRDRVETLGGGEPVRYAYDVQPLVEPKQMQWYLVREAGDRGTEKIEEIEGSPTRRFVYRLGGDELEIAEFTEDEGAPAEFPSGAGVVRLRRRPAGS